jgi:hypothetical protein
MKFKLSTAQAAIQARLMDTRQTPDPLEQQAITDALNSLSALKRNAAWLSLGRRPVYGIVYNN